MSFHSTLAGDSAHATLSGTVDDFNPAVLADRPSLSGHIKGAIAADLTFDSLSAGMHLSTTSATVTSELGPSSIGDVSVDRATVAGAFKDMVVDFQTLEAIGVDIRVTGNGTLAFNDTGKSGFWLHAEAGDLATVGKLIGQPLSGIAVLDAVVGGNQREFTATGTLTGDGLKYGTIDALSSSAEFKATIPNLAWERTTGNATTNATFVNIAGLQVNRVTAKTDFADSRVMFDMSAEQPQRSLTAGGSLLVRPEDRELRLQQLKFVTQGVTLQTPPGQEAVITYSQPSIGVHNFRLRDATMQQIAADGTFGRPGDVLKVNFGNIDMGLIDALLLRPVQLSGRLNGTSEITGTKDALVVNTTFQVDRGKFQNFSYEGLQGTVQYAPQGATVDVRLQQTAEQWLTAKGHVPLAAFRQEGVSTDRYDVHVDSSLIDLGLVQGLTTRVTGVTGTLQLKADVTGSADAPRVDGGLTVQRGAFKVEDTGVRYTGLDGRVELQGDRVHIDALQLRDNQNKLLTVSGDLGVRATQVETVNLAVAADDFKVIDNEMGNVRVRSAMRVAGALAAPRLEGDLRITSGTLNLDRILARAAGSAYPTSPSTGPIDAGAGGKGVSKAPLGWEGVQADVHLMVDNNLVVKAGDISGSDRLVGLGSINLTLGGDLNVAKKAGEPLTLVGNVNTVRGFYDFQGRRFTIQRDGFLQFEGDPVNRLNPRLAVTGERVISAVTARVSIGGRLRRPELTFTSTPPLDPSDILALIVFNQPLNELGANAQQSVTKRAGELAVGVGTSQLTSSIASSLKLDQFDINLSPDTGSAADLTIGQQIGGNLYVRVQQGLGQRSQTNVVLEYEFSKWLRLRTNVQEGATTQQQLFQRVQSTGADLVFTFAFK
jgi:autotransporter translocation and assembly factor TamB